MAALVKWLLRRRDQCSVLYAPFGVPGDTNEERLPPTSITVAPFDDNHPDFIFMRLCHAQRAAVASAGFGMSFVILMFISAFFEFDWYHHKKGIDLLALLTLFFYLALGVLIHYYVILGVKQQSANYLLPFIVVYMVVIGSELVASLYPLLHIRSPTDFVVSEAMNHVILFSLIVFLIVTSVQALMLAAVCKCRLYLSCKQAHQMAMRIAERSRSKNPGLQIVMVSASNVTPTCDSTISTEEITTDNATMATEQRSSQRQDIEQIDAQMHFTSIIQPPPYAASGSLTYAYDQPTTTTTNSDSSSSLVTAKNTNA